ncbi:MAG: LPS-assembly protein LptD [Halanaerobium sp.]
MLKTNRVYYQKIIFTLLISSIFIISCSIYSAASDSAYTLRGDEISFREQEDIIIFAGNASFNSDDFTIEADRFTVDRAAKTVKAKDQVLLISDRNELSGDSLEYNYQTDQGTLYGADTEIGELKLSGSRLNILSTSPVEGVLDDAEFTSCIREEPHYHFEAKEIRINPDNTVGIYSIVPHILNVPVFYLPYYSVTYDSDAEDGEQSLSSTYPFPTVGYEQRVGVTVEFSYPYQLSENNSGKFYYWKAGDEEKDINFEHNYNFSDNLSFKVNYNYLYEYDTDEDVIDEEEEDASTSLYYSRDRLNLETGLYRDLMKNEDKNLYFIETDYSFKSGINAELRQEYDDKERTAETYVLSGNSRPISWNLKYIDGESYNYYPYLSLDSAAYYGFSPYVSFGRVENGGKELNKYRFGYDFNYNLDLPLGFSYHLDHRYRLDNYRSGYDQNYHYRRLNTGIRYRKQLTDRININTALFYEENTVGGESPLPDDREDEDELLRPSLSLDLKGELPQSAWFIDSDGEYNLRTEEWDEITLRIRKKEDCFNAFVGYEFIEDSIVFGLEL